MDYVPLTPEESKQQNWGCLAFICFIPTLFSGFFIFMQIHDRNVKDFFKPENFNFFLTIGGIFALSLFGFLVGWRNSYAGAVKIRAAEAAEAAKIRAAEAAEAAKIRADVAKFRAEEAAKLRADVATVRAAEELAKKRSKNK